MLWQTFLAGLSPLLATANYATGKSMLQRPVVMGPLVGIALGDIQTGLVVGGTLQLAFMGNMAIGAAIPPEITAGGVLGTAFAITSGSARRSPLRWRSPSPRSRCAIKNLFYLMIRSQFMLHAADKFAAEGNVDGVSLMHDLGYRLYAEFVMTLACAVVLRGKPRHRGPDRRLGVSVHHGRHFHRRRHSSCTRFRHARQHVDQRQGCSLVRCGFPATPAYLNIPALAPFSVKSSLLVGERLPSAACRGNR